MPRSIGKQELTGFSRALIRPIGSLLFPPAGSRARNSAESGQVLVMTAAAGIALMGFLALVIDIGNIYFERRAAQNVADTAALVGAQDRQGTMPSITLVTSSAVKDARTYAVKNGFTTDTGANNNTCNGEVCVYIPPQSPPSSASHTTAQYIEVDITRTVNTAFAGVLGINNVTVTAHAVARASQIGMDAATISLAPGPSSTVVSGGSGTIVDGNTYSWGDTYQNGGGALNVDGYAFAGGTFNGSISAADGKVSGAAKIGDPGWSMCGPFVSGPGVSFNSNIGQTPDPQGYIWINPGTYDWISVASGNKVKFNPGVYHVTKQQGVTINGDALGQGPLCFVLDDPNSSFQSAGTSTVELFSGWQYNNILIWTNSRKGTAVKITGGSSVVPGFGTPFQGTIYAPFGQVTLAGGSTGAVQGQVVANYISLSGGAAAAVTYDPTHAAGTPKPALVE